MIMSKQSGVSNIIYGLLVIAILSAAIFGLTRLESTFDTELSDINTEVASISPSISRDPAISVSATADSSIINYQHYTIDYGLDQEFYNSGLQPDLDLLLNVYLTNTTSISDYFDTDEYMGYFSSNSLKSYPTFIPTNHDTHSCETLFPDVHTHSFSISEEFINVLTSTEEFINVLTPTTDTLTIQVQKEIPFVVDREKASLLDLLVNTHSSVSLKFKYDTNGSAITDIPIYLDSIVCTISGDTSEDNLSSLDDINLEYANAANLAATLASESLVGDVNVLLASASLFNLDGNATEIKLIGDVYVTHSDDIATLKIIYEQLMFHFINNNGLFIKAALAFKLAESYIQSAGTDWDSATANMSQTQELFLVNKNKLDANIQKIDDAISLAEDDCEIEFAADNSGNMVLSNGNGATDSPVCQYPDDAFAENLATIDGTDYIQLSSYNGTCDLANGGNGIVDSHSIQIVYFGDIASESSNSFVREDITVSAFKPDAYTLKITINGANVSYGGAYYDDGEEFQISMTGNDLCLYWANEEW